MSPNFKKFFSRWLINTAGVAAASCLIKKIHWNSMLSLVMASLLLGILNMFVRPFLMLLSLPIMIFTLGLFTFVINALLLYWVGMLLYPGFAVETFGAAFWGAVVITLVSLFLNSLTGTGTSRIQVKRGGGRPPRPPKAEGPGGGGPVIDV